MTQSEDNGSAQPRQPKTFQILLPMGLWFTLPDTWSNRRGAMILLRGLHRRDGWPLVTYEHLAQALGYADRRNVHNFWAEFETCGGDLAAFLQRRKKVDAEVVARCESIWKAHPLWTCAQVLAEFRRRWPAQGAELSEQNMRTAGHQVGFLGGQQGLRRQLAEGEAHYWGRRSRGGISRSSTRMGAMGSTIPISMCSPPVAAMIARTRAGSIFRTYPTRCSGVN